MLTVNSLLGFGVGYQGPKGPASFGDGADGVAASASSITLANYVVTNADLKDLLVVFVGMESGDPPPSISSVTFDSINLTLVGSSNVGTTTQATTSLWTLANPGARTGNIVATLSAATSELHIIAGLARNVNPTAITTQSATGQTIASLTQNWTETGDGIVIDGATTGDSTNFSPSGTGKTELAESNGTTSAMAVGAKVVAGGLTATSLGHSFTASLNRSALYGVFLRNG